MADRTAAELFGEIFGLIADHVAEPEKKAVALRFWDRSRGYDFSPYQMYAEDSLEKLGLARMGIDPEYPEDGETWLYGPDGDE